MHVHAAPGATPVCPRSSAVDALQAMLLRGGSEEVVQRMELEGGWRLLGTSAGHEEGVARLARFSSGNVWGTWEPAGPA